jgi:putative tricarboxylic transport membrane protein
MRMPDFWTGLAFAVIGIAIVAKAQGLHIPAGAASPKLFPTIIGSFMALFGGLIALRGLRDAGSVVLPAWTSSPRVIALILFLPVAIMFYGLVAPILGSTFVAIILVAIHCVLYGIHPASAVAIGLTAGVVTTFIFTHGLGVPLPQGVILGGLFQ